ncbi:unnamed protein product [Protopolystoma xenopodis]|uniref:Uncharacterized protein n=1 Tax=Protopolystoma xenopodis TaxID=117903 RepID=A0A448XHC2_9PLAT|nr:unnamed protein product [Protopolystoma xenopodis]
MSRIRAHEEAILVRDRVELESIRTRLDEEAKAQQKEREVLRQARAHLTERTSLLNEIEASRFFSVS